MKNTTYESLEEELSAIHGEYESVEPGSFEERAVLMKLLKFAEGFSDLDGAIGVFKQDFWKATTHEEIFKCFSNFYWNCFYFAKDEDARNYAPPESDEEVLAWRNA